VPLSKAAVEPIPQDRTSLSRFFADMRRYPRLSKERERSVAANVRLGDTPALHELVQSNLAFVVKVARQYRNYGVPFEDLLNEGNVGLLEAAKRYDPTKDNKFVTYAIWWIRKAILQALTEQSVVRVPPYQMRRVREIQETESALARSLGRRPERNEVSEKLDRSVDKVDEVLQFATRPVSLDEKVGRDREISLADLLVDEHASNPEDDLIRHEAHQLVTDALRHLNKREREVITLRHGIAEERPLTLQETGERMRLSRERVRQIECEAKARLRRFFARRLASNVQLPPISGTSCAPASSGG
jgi:RNA polymerase primary sigma factor